MRQALAIAAAFLLPTMLHAQAMVPATTQASPNAPVIEARLTMPAEPGQPSALAYGFDGIPVASPVRVTTGITPPELISMADIHADNDVRWHASGEDKIVVVSMIVNKAGKPTNLKITKSAGEELDNNVLASVAKYHYKPGQLNHQPTEVEVNLEIIIHAPSF
ncbi:TonB family protein [Granulicella aggregans]|uniref:TonB family protein n=1 Tax=Granulicella aggregans TaxID=474949 RepID=A0A7W8E2G7_9BACT|nr:TonB family protein [Granulicella aggregans]MBB5056356.1 TonB family protein [Granulicella aggregans]